VCIFLGRGHPHHVDDPSAIQSANMIKVPTKMSKKVVGMIFRVPKTKKIDGVVTTSGNSSTLKRDSRNRIRQPPLMDSLIGNITRFKKSDKCGRTIEIDMK